MSRWDTSWYETDGGMISILVAVVILSGIGCKACDGWTTGRGQMTGQITRFAQDGAVWQTNEGTLSLGYTSGGTGTVSVRDQKFCVELTDPSTASAVEDARDSGKPVKLTYFSLALPLPWHCASDHVVTKVEYISGLGNK